MHTNPYPKMIGDGVSDTQVPNQRYEDWEAGYKTCWHDVRDIIDKAGLVISSQLTRLLRQEAHGERKN